MGRLALPLAVAVLLLDACDRGTTYARPRRQPREDVAEQAATGPSPVERQPVAFQGRGFLSNADIAGLNYETDPRVSEVVQYERVGDGHYYRFAGAWDLEVRIFPCADGAEASSLVSKERTSDINYGKTGMAMGKIVHHEMHDERIAGDSGWWSETIRGDTGQGVIKVAFSKGPFMAVVLTNDKLRGKSDFGPIKERGFNAARYVANKLR